MLSRSAYRSQSTAINTTVIAAVAIASFPALAVSAQLGDVQRGRTYATEVCAQCHAVAPDATKSPRADATPFAVIAQVSGLNHLALTAFLQTTHAEMPNLVVVGQERDDLVAYILSLRHKR